MLAGLTGCPADDDDKSAADGGDSSDAAQANDTDSGAGGGSDSGKAERDAGATDKDAGGGQPSGNGAYKVTVLELPAGLMAAAPLALNDAGDVLYAGGSSFTFDSIHIHHAGKSTPVPLAADQGFTLNGLNADGCINNEGQAAFNATVSGQQHAVFFDGKKTVAIDFGGAAVASSLIVRDCNDNGVVVASTVTGTDAYIWKAGKGTPIMEGGFGLTIVAINESDVVAASGGFFEDGAFTEFPDGVELTVTAGLTEDYGVAGTVIDAAAGKLTAVTWKKGDAKVSELPKPDGFDGVFGVVAMGENGDVVVSGDTDDKTDPIWVYRDGKYTAVDVPGYKIAKVVDVNAKGVILVSGTTADDSKLNAGMLLTP